MAWGNGLRQGMQISGDAGRAGRWDPIRWGHDHVDLLLIPVAILLFLGLWQLVACLGLYPPFILPSPHDVYRRLLLSLADGSLWWHARFTLIESLAGFALGFIMATAVGYGLAKAPLAERIASPYIVASQSIPIVALAPLLILWFGFGIMSKILICALVVFFPILISTIVGVRGVDSQYLELMRSLAASPWQTFVKVEVPAALPVLFGGIRVGITLSVVGAVVGEFVGADRGLGFLVNLAKGLFDTPLMFVALLALAIIAMTLYGLILLLESRLLAWRG